MKLKLLLSLAFVVLTLLVSAQPALALSGFTQPVHFDDTIWNLSSRSGYNDLSVDLTVNALSGQGDAYYYSLSPYFSNGVNVYAGLQTNGSNGSANVGKMLIFSIWNVNSGLAEPGGSGSAFGGEGNGYSVRLPYNWSVGATYRLKIYIDQDAASGNRLWGASITNLSNGQTQRIGRIYAPVAYGKIYNPVTFHERYMGAVQSCANMSGSQVSFANVMANAGSLHATSWSHYAVANIPDCSAVVWLRDFVGGYTSTAGIGKPAPAVAAPPAKAPVAALKPVTPAPAAVAPVVTPTKPVVLGKTDAHQASSATTTKSSNRWARVLAYVLIIAIVAATVFTLLMHRRWRKLRHSIASHFPHDFDIHGIKR